LWREKLDTLGNHALTVIIALVLSALVSVLALVIVWGVTLSANCLFPAKKPLVVDFIEEYSGFEAVGAFISMFIVSIIAMIRSGKPKEEGGVPANGGSGE
jgi:hypothetical protein